MWIDFRCKFVEDGTNNAHNVNIGPFVAAPDVISLADPSATRDQVECAGVIVNVEPVADI